MLLLIIIQLNLGSRLVCAIAVDATKVDSTEAWWNQSTFHSMAQRPGGWGQGALHSMAQRPGGVRELWLNFHVA